MVSVLKKNTFLVIPALALLGMGAAQAQTNITSGYATSVPAGTVTLNGGGLLAGNDVTFTVTNNIVLGTNGGLFRAYSAYVSGIWPFQTSHGDGILVINGPVSGSGAATVQDGGQMQFNASNSFTGNTTFQDTGNGGPSVYLGNVNAFSGSTVVLSNLQAMYFSVAGTNTYNFGGLSGSQNQALGANSLSVGGNNQNATYSGVLSGSGGFVKRGTGTETLTGANSFTGGVTVNGGALVLSNTLANNANNDITINSGGTLKLAAQDVFTSWTGTVAPTITVNAGGVLANNGVNFNTLGAVVLNGGTIQSLGASGTNASSTAFGLKGSVSVIGSGTSTIAGDGIALGEAGVTSTTFDVTSGSTLDVTGALVNGDKAYQFLVSNWGDKQASSLVKTGSGLMILEGANTYTGTTTISGGTLQVGNGGTAGTLGTNSVVNNGTLAFDRSDHVNYSNSTTGSGAIEQIGSGTTTLLDGSPSTTGGVIVRNGALEIGTGGASDLVVGGGASGSGDLLVTGGTLSDSLAYIGYASNSTGSATVSGGDWTNKGNLFVAYYGSGTLSVSDGTVSSSNCYVGGRFSVVSGSTNSGTVNISGGALTVAHELAVGGNSNNSSAAGTASLSISGGTVSDSICYIGKTGDGSVSVSGGSFSSGQLIVGWEYHPGTLSITGGTVTSSVCIAGQYDNAVGTISVTGGTFNTGYITLGSGDNNGMHTTGTLSISGSGTVSVQNGSGAVNLGVGMGDTGYLNLGTGGELLAGSIHGYNANSHVTIDSTETRVIDENLLGYLKINQLGTGTTVLTGSNSYGGITTISAGMLQIGNGGTTGTLGSGSFVDNATLSFNRSDTLTVTNAISGTGAVIQAGSGTTVLTGSNSYSGATTVSGGTLQVDSGGSVASSTTAVQNGGTLLNNGTVAGTTTVHSGGTLAGNGGTFQNVALEGGASLNWTISDASGSAGSGWDLLNATNIDLSNLSSTNRFTINLLGAPANFLNKNQTFEFFNVTGLTTGFDPAHFVVDASGLTLDPSITGGTWAVVQLNSPSGALALTYTAADPQAVPEPSTYALFGLGVLALVIAARRRRAA